jgi:regulatory protein
MTPDPLQRAKDDALKALRRQALSRARLLAQLARRGHDDGVAERAVREMERLGLINDNALAADVVDRELGRSPAGEALLEAKLRQREVDEHAADAAVSGALRGRSQSDDALEAARRRLARSGVQQDPQATLRRLVQHLARRGFDAEVAWEAAVRAAAEAGIAVDEAGP